MIPIFDGLVVIALYALANIAVFCLYVYDKHMARTDGWRIPERILIVAALFGPFGAYGAMRSVPAQDAKDQILARAVLPCPAYRRNHIYHGPHASHDFLKVTVSTTGTLPL